LKILHTSDWHLGNIFKGRNRISEHEKFLEWLLEIIEEEKIDVLIVAGDIFDTSNPPNYALKMYHNFLANLSKTNLKHTFIIAGNHDSIATLEVSKEILKAFNIHIVAKEGIVKLVNDIAFCVVPYLRENILKPKSLEISEAENEIQEAIKIYYEDIYQKAKTLNPKKIIATGHLSVSGAISTESEREIYIGKLKSLSNDIFEKFDYVALGHIHKPQVIADNIRYSGSIIPFSFGEIETKKIFVIDSENMNVLEKDIPNFRKLFRLNGEFEELLDKLEEIKDIENPPFVEIESKNLSLFEIDKLKIEGVDIVAIKQQLDDSQKVLQESINIEELNPFIVFEKRLEIENIDEKDKIMELYKSIVSEVEDES